MATREPAKKTRMAIRHELQLEFVNMMNEMIVVSDTVKRYLIKEYLNAIDRLTKEIPTGARNAGKWWVECTNDDLWYEYDKAAKQLKMVDIFSDKFYTTIRSKWDHMLNTFNPNATCYKD